jgi:hypothetical protein
MSDDPRSAILSRQLTVPSFAVGKTIAAIAEYTYGPLVIRFTDDTWLAAVVEHGYDGDSGVEIDNKAPEWSYLIGAVMTRAEYDAIQAVERIERNARDDAQERRQYELLKAKFG